MSVRRIAPVVVLAFLAGCAPRNAQPVPHGEAVGIVHPRAFAFGDAAPIQATVQSGNGTLVLCDPNNASRCVTVQIVAPAVTPEPCADDSPAGTAADADRGTDGRAYACAYGGADSGANGSADASTHAGATIARPHGRSDRHARSYRAAYDRTYRSADAHAFTGTDTGTDTETDSKADSETDSKADAETHRKADGPAGHGKRRFTYGSHRLSGRFYDSSGFVHRWLFCQVEQR